MGKRSDSTLENQTSAILVEDENLSTNKAGAVIPLTAGENRTAIRWLTPIYGQRVIKVPSAAGGKKGGGGGKKGGSNTKDQYRGTFAGCLGEGPAWSLEAIEVGGRRVWSGGLSNPGDADYSELDLIDIGHARFYWGTETQIADPDLEVYRDHPGYRSQVYIVLIDCKLDIDGGQNMPTVEVFWRRVPNQLIVTGGPSANDGGATANPVVMGAELLTSWSWAQRSASELNIPSFQATAESLYAESIPDTNRHYTSIAPLFNEKRTLRSALREISEISKTWLRYDLDGKIECGRWKRDGSIEGVTSLTYVDCESHGTKTRDNDNLKNSFDVRYRNCMRRFNEDIASAHNTAAITSTNTDPGSVELNMIIWADQALAQANDRLRESAIPQTTLTLSVRRPKAYHADGKPIRPGDYFLFPINEPGETPDIRLWRCTRRSFGPFGPVEIIGELETNGAITAVPAVVPEVEVAEVTPPIAYSRVLAINPEKSDDQPGVTVLAARPSDMSHDFSLYYSSTVNGDYARIGGSSGWALPMSLVEDFAIGESTVRLKLLPGSGGANPQRERLLLTNWNGGDNEGRDDQLFIVLLRKDGSGNIVMHGDETQWVEFLSVIGPATPVATDTFDVPVIRGRRGTVDSDFTAGTFPDVWTNYEAWVIPRSTLANFIHADFPALIDDDDPGYFRVTTDAQSGTYDPEAAYEERTRRVSEGIPLAEFANQGGSGAYYPQITYDFPLLRLAPLYSNSSVSARTVSIAANSAAFLRSTGSDEFLPSTITLVATPYNVPTPAYQWSYHNGTEFVDLVGETGSTLTVGNSSFTETSRTFRVAVGSPPVHDQMTIMRLSDATGYNANLSNEFQLVACDAAGTPFPGQLGSGGSAFTDIRVWRGAVELTGSLDDDPPESGNFRMSIESTGGSFTVVDANTIRCDSMSGDAATAVVTIQCELDLQVLTKTFTVSKSRAGAGYWATSTSSHTIGLGSKSFGTQQGLAYVAGSRMRAIYALNPAIWMEGEITSYLGSTLVLNVDKVAGSGTYEDWNFTLVGTPGQAGASEVVTISSSDGLVFFMAQGGTTFTPTTITLTANVAGVTSPSLLWQYWNGTAWTNAGSTGYTLTVAYSAFTGSRTYRVAVSGGASTIYDQVTMIRITDPSAYYVSSSNELHTVVADSSGVVQSGQLGVGSNAFTTFRVFRGNQELTAVASSSPGSGEFYIGGGMTGGTFTVVSLNTVRCDAMTADVATANVSIVLENSIQTLSRTFKVVKAKAGVNGVDGASATLVTLYRRSASSPAKPTTTGTYDFSANTISGINNGWTIVRPASNGQPLWAIAAVARANPPATTDTIAAGEWSDPIDILYDGEDGLDGFSRALLSIYIRAGSTPPKPSATVTYTFATGELTGLNNGWSFGSVPAGTGPIYISTAAALSSGPTDTVSPSEWADVQMMAKDGEPGTPGTNGSGYGGTSTTSVAIGVGTKMFSIGLGFAYVPNVSRVRVAYQSAPTNWMEGTCISYSSGIIAINVDITGGSGTYASWVFSLAGTRGSDGDTGPGTVYQGDYSNTVQYFKTSIRRDIVKHGGNFYITANAAKSGLTGWSAPPSADWESFGATYRSVATALLMTEDAVVTNIITLGNGVVSGGGILRTHGAISYGSGNGIWIGLDGLIPKLRVGNPTGNRFYHDGTNTGLVGRFSAGVGDSLLTADETGTYFGNPTGRHIRVATFAAGTTILQARNNTTVLATLGAYDIGAGQTAASLSVSTSSGVTGNFGPAGLALAGATLYNSSGNLKTDNHFIAATLNTTSYVSAGQLYLNGVTGAELGLRNLGSSYNEVRWQIGVAFDIQGVNQRWLNAAGAQVSRVDIVTGRYWLGGNPVLNTRYTGDTSTEAGLQACLRHHGLCT